MKHVDRRSNHHLFTASVNSSKMFQKPFRFVLLLLVFHQASSYSMQEEDSLTLLYAYKEKYLFWSFCVFLMAIIRYILKVYDLPIFCDVFLIIIGVLCGILCMHVKWFYVIAKNSQSNKILTTLHYLYLPVVMFSTAFSLDIYMFSKCMFQIISISVLAATMSSVFTGVMMELVSDMQWDLVDGLIFGSITAFTYPIEVLKFFSESNVAAKYLTCFLHGECMVSAIVAVNMNLLLVMHRSGYVVHWYQFISGLLRTVILGIPVGYIFGSIGVCMMRFTYNKSSLLMLFTFASCYTSFFFGDWIGNGPIFSVIITGIMMGRERSSLSMDIQARLTDLWTIFTYIFTSIIIITMSVRAPSLLEDVNLKEYILVFVTYLVSNVTRFLSFVLFVPIFSRSAYGMSFKHLIICVWCGLKNPTSILLASSLFGIMGTDGYRQKQIFLHMLGLYFLTLLINGTFVPVLLRALGLSDISMTRQTNMNNCMKFIYDARMRSINILKMDRLLADANWPLVLGTTALKHPYRKFNVLDDQAKNEDDEDFFLGYRFAYCPDCQKHIPNEPTPKEIKDMTKEAKVRILKMRKCIYSRLYENGLMAKKSLRILHQAVELALDSHSGAIELENLVAMFDKERKFLRCFYSVVQWLFSSKSSNIKLPRIRWRFWCYVLIHHWVFKVVLVLAVLFNLIIDICDLFGRYQASLENLLIFLNLAEVLTFVVVFFFRVFAFSTEFIVKDGLRNYFKFVSNYVESLIVCAGIGRLILKFTFLFDASLYYLNLLVVILMMLRLAMMISFVKHLSCAQSFVHFLSLYFERQIDSNRSLAFELAACYVTAENEILMNLPQIIENKKVRDKIKTKIEADRKELHKVMSQFHKKKCVVTSSLKTKVAVNSVLNSMKEELEGLKVSGWVDDVEYSRLQASLEERFKLVNNIQFTEPCSPMLIFQGVCYMGNDTTLARFLSTNISSRRYDPGGVVVERGEIADGVCILITGTFVLQYTPDEETFNMLQMYGALPIMDYICPIQYDAPTVEYTTPGNTMGELSILTDRPYDGRIVADTHSEALFLSSRVIKDAIKNDDDPVGGFECRMWKACTFYTALGVLLNVPSYRVLTHDKIVAALERAFVPNLNNYKIFTITAMMNDIVLVHGTALDFNTRDLYVAPYYIPRAVQKLILPRSSLYNFTTPIQTKLMILPAKDFDEYEIMLAEEQICVMADEDDAKNLHDLLHGSISSAHKSLKKLKKMMKTNVSLRSQHL